MELDRNIALERAARATMESYSGTVQKSKIDLSYAKVLAPIEGIAGIAQVKIGNLVGKAEPTLLTTISNVNPVRVAFPITEPEYLNAADALKKPETMGNGEGYLELILANGKVYAKKGRLAVANREFDPRTGTMTLQALFPNPDLLLRPGQYGRVRAVVRNVKDALAIPQRAVAELQGITQVAVVGPQEKIEIRPVKLGERSGSFWIVASGLKAGDRVVAEGLQKVKPDMTVVPKPFDVSALRQPDAATDTPELIPGATTPAPSGKPSGP
jgi:membrane fusion protein, multidrug efflux system